MISFKSIGKSIKNLRISEIPSSFLFYNNIIFTFVHSNTYYDMKKLLILGMVLAAFASCTDHKSLFDSERVKQEAKENFPVKDVDPNQDWNMMAVRTLDVTMDTNTGASYTVKVLTDNPFKADNDARILAEAEVKDGTTVSLKFDAPSAMQYAYVMRQMGDKDFVVTVATLKNDKFVAAFGRSTAQRAASARATNIEIDNLPDNDKDFICPSGAKGVTKGDIGKHLKAGSYFISADVTTDKINFADGVVLYITSGFTFTLTADKVDKGTIIVCADGTLNIERTEENDKTFTLKGSIYNKGTVDIHADEFSMQNKEARLINYGAMQVAADFEFKAGEFYNGEDGRFSVDETSIDSNSTDGANEHKSSATWVNDGYYTCYEFEVSSGYQLQNNCNLYLGESFELEGNNGKDVIFNNSGFIFSEESAKLKNATLNMAGKSIFKTQSLEFENSVRLNSDASVQDKDKPLLLCVEGASYDDDKGELTMSGVTNVTCGNDFFEPWSASGHALLVNATVGDNAQGCNPEYENGAPDVEPDLGIVTYAFEDITTTVGDYDFNDVVLKVTVVKDEEVTVALAAAGASKELSVGCKVNGRDNVLWGSVHEALGVSAGTIVNPGPSTWEEMPKQTIKNIESLADVVFYIYEKNNPDLRVYISQDDPEFIKGDVPFALCIPTDWVYPAERQMINEKYGDFGAWGAHRDSHQDWYKTPTK